MSRALTAPFLLSNGSRVEYLLLSLNRRAQEIVVEATMRTAAGGNPQDAEIARVTLSIRNGRSDRVRRAVVPNGGKIRDALETLENAANSPTGFTDALAAYRQSDNAFENHVATAAAGYIDASLAST